MSRFGELIQTKRDEKGQSLLGLAYLHKKEAPAFKDSLESLATDPRSDDVPWEGVLLEGNIPFKARLFRQNSFHAFKTIADPPGIRSRQPTPRQPISHTHLRDPRHLRP